MALAEARVMVETTSAVMAFALPMVMAFALLMVMVMPTMRSWLWLLTRIDHRPGPTCDAPGYKHTWSILLYTGMQGIHV